MDAVDALDRAFAAGLVTAICNIPPDDFLKPFSFGVPYSADIIVDEFFQRWVREEKLTLLYHGMRKSGTRLTMEVLEHEVVSSRRIENINKVHKNINKRIDMLQGVDLAISPALRLLEPYRYLVRLWHMQAPDGILIRRPVATAKDDSKISTLAKPEAALKFRAAGVHGQNTAQPVQEDSYCIKSDSKHKQTAATLPRRRKISQKLAAELCGVGKRSVQYWDKGVRVPEGYPGRGNEIVFIAWANSYQGEKRMLTAARAMNRATPMDPNDLDNVSHRSAFDDE